MVKSILVYCGSSEGTDPIYMQCAKDLGKKMAEKGIRLVYGGGTSGLMGAVSSSVEANGGKVLGIIPSGLIQRERRDSHNELSATEKAPMDPTKAGSNWKPRALASSTENNETILVESMHERKKLMTDNADALVVLPGGYGTMDELFEGLTWSQLNIHKKPIVLLNINGYYDHLLTFIDTSVKAGFVSAAARTLVASASTVDEVLELCMGGYQKQLLPGARFEALNWTTSDA